jgi:altronate dehydratase small subunit
MPDEPIDALVLDPRDTVATALRPLAPGEAVRIGTPSGRVLLVVREAVPLCHKVALVDLEAGAAVHKYGEPIGELTRAVHAGELIHVHNLRSRRARGPAG